MLGKKLIKLPCKIIEPVNVNLKFLFIENELNASLY